MKEAAGEANMTVITIVLIAIVLGVGIFVVTTMMNNTSERGNQVNNTNTGSCPNGFTWNGTTCVQGG